MLGSQWERTLGWYDVLLLNVSQQSHGEVDRTRDWDGLCLVSDSHKGSQDRSWHLGLFQFFPTGSLLPLPLDLHLQPGVMCGEGD